MNIKSNNTIKYKMLKALRGSKPAPVNIADSATIEESRNRYRNQDLLISSWQSEVPDMSALRNYSLCFRIVTPDLEKARVSALETGYYIAENFNIPAECMEFIYNGGGEIGNSTGGNGNQAGENTDSAHNSAATNCISAGIGIHARENDSKTGHVAHNNGNNPVRRLNNGIAGADNADYVLEKAGASRNCPEAGSIPASTGIHVNEGGGKTGQHNPVAAVGNQNICGSSKGAKEGTTAAEIMILIPPVVFDGLSTPLMPALNYPLARQMADDGIENINIDVYQRDHFIRLPNSINTTTGKFVIPLSMKELLYLDANGIAELSKQPKPEDSMILPHRVPEVVDRFVEIHAEFEKKLLRQDELQKLMLEKGWEVTPCIRRLQQLCLYDNIRLEAYRVISQFYSWIGAGPDEIRYLIHSVDQRNPIRNYQKMNAIIAFAIENPWFIGCRHPLLEQFCSAGKCFMAELIEEYEKPYLFEQV